MMQLGGGGIEEDRPAAKLLTGDLPSRKMPSKKL
jgi:hypothetical protein